MTLRARLPALWALTLCVLLVTACTSVIADFDLEAYRNATSLKARSLSVIELAGEPYSRHAERAEALMTDINAAYEFAAGLPRNNVSARQWDLIRDPEGGLMGGFVRHWQAAGEAGLPDFFRQEAKRGIARAFDEIICLEVNKRESASCARVASAEQ